MWRSGNNLWESVLAFHHVGPGDCLGYQAWQQAFLPVGATSQPPGSLLSINKIGKSPGGSLGSSPPHVGFADEEGVDQRREGPHRDITIHKYVLKHSIKILQWTLWGCLGQGVTEGVA